MREPQGLVYRVVNFDLLDEYGRNFVFSSQDVNDRTAGITIDFGQGSVESYRIATHNLYDTEGHMQPITMQRALEIVGNYLSRYHRPGMGRRNRRGVDRVHRAYRICV